MSDRLKSVLQINGGDNLPPQLYSRELYITSDGYLYSGNPTGEAEDKSGATGISVAFANEAANMDIKDTQNNTLLKVDKANRVIQLTNHVFVWGNSIRFKDGENKDDWKGWAFRYTAAGETQTYDVSFGNTYMRDGYFHHVRELLMAGPLHIHTCHLAAQSNKSKLDGMFGTKLPTTGLTDGQLFFLIEN